MGVAPPSKGFNMHISNLPNSPIRTTTENMERMKSDYNLALSLTTINALGTLNFTHRMIKRVL